MRHLLAALMLLSASPANAANLQIAAVDVEGGGALLLKTPEGQSLLIDTGWAPGRGGPQAATLPTSAERILTAAKAMGISTIDYLVMTHYHADHLGGLEAAVARARALARIPENESVRFKRYPEALSPWEALSEAFGVQSEAAQALVMLGGVMNDPAAQATMRRIQADRARQSGATVLADQPLG